MTSSTEVVVHELAGTVVLELHGTIDRSASDALADAYAQTEGMVKAAHVVLDFTDVEYINSSGIALVVSVLARARAEGRGVAAIGLTEHYRHIFDITRLSDFIDICPDLDTALQGRR